MLIDELTHGIATAVGAEDEDVAMARKALETLSMAEWELHSGIRDYASRPNL